MTGVKKYTVLGEYEGEEHKKEGNQPYSWVVRIYFCIHFTSFFPMKDYQ